MLCYSPSLDGAFCLACILFGDRFPAKRTKTCNLFSQPLHRWNDASIILKHHSGLMGWRWHGCTFPAFFKNIVWCYPTQPIEVIIENNVKKEVEASRSKLRSTVDTVLTCFRLGLPFRDHRDGSQYHREIGSFSSGGVGNFVELLNFRVRDGNKVLEVHLTSCGKNRSYISKTFQNKVIKCCGEVITEKIIIDDIASNFFSIIADEVHLKRNRCPLLCDL